MSTSFLSLSSRELSWGAKCKKLQKKPFATCRKESLKLVRAVTQASKGKMASTLLSSISPLPQLIVFDLDYTLWPFWCEMYTTRDEPSLYPHSMEIMQACRAHKLPMAIASRTPTPKVAQAFMRKLGITELFDSIQLIPASSGVDHSSAQKDKAHFPAIKRGTGIPYSGMLFFDDESPNITKVSRLGVTSILAPSGLSLQLLEKGLRQYAAEHADGKI